MFEVSTELHFSSSHYLREYRGSCENLHGHNWLIRATVRSEKLNKIGLSIDFKILKKHLKAICEELDHVDLNTVFVNINPSAENIAKHIFEKLALALKAESEAVGVKVSRIDVWETPGNCASYFEGV